jgi:ribosomal protein L21E
MKVGDRVKVVRDWCVLEGESPSRFVGKVGEVVLVEDSASFPISVRFAKGGFGVGWAWFNEDELELVEE